MKKIKRKVQPTHKPHRCRRCCCYSCTHRLSILHQLSLAKKRRLKAKRDNPFHSSPTNAIIRAHTHSLLSLYAVRHNTRHYTIELQFVKPYFIGEKLQKIIARDFRFVNAYKNKCRIRKRKKSQIKAD